MALIHSIEEEGLKLFKYRGQIPVILFILAIPVIYFTDYESIGSTLEKLFIWKAIAVSVAGFVVRAITIGTTPKGTSGRNRDEQVAESLNSKGIYSMVRHPLYLGNYLMWIGIVLYTFNIYYTIIVTLAYWLYYERIMFAEERFLERKFGQAYLDWSMQAPAFWPSTKGYIKSDISFSIKAVLRREYSGFLATVVGFLFVDIVRNYIETKSFVFDQNAQYILGGSVIITLILRSLKHYTQLLHEDDRS